MSDTNFWFSAYIKHTDVEILSERQRICDLLDHFGLSDEAQATVDDAKAREFVARVADLSIWGYDRNDGTPYEECEEPCEGLADSHECLMGLIERARTIQKGS